MRLFVLLWLLLHHWLLLDHHWLLVAHLHRLDVAHLRLHGLLIAHLWLHRLDVAHLRLHRLNVAHLHRLLHGLLIAHRLLRQRLHHGHWLLVAHWLLLLGRVCSRFLLLTVRRVPTGGQVQFARLLPVVHNREPLVDVFVHAEVRKTECGRADEVDGQQVFVADGEVNVVQLVPDFEVKSL